MSEENQLEKTEGNKESAPDKDDAEVARAELEEKEREEVKIFMNDLECKISAKSKLREENLKCVRPPEEYFSRLDSSLKKNTAFVKKLKQFTSSQLDSIMKDMIGLNLTKYISEICTALAEAKLKMTDVVPVITLCSKLSQIYVDFGSQFFESWQKILTIKAGEKISNPSKMRVDLRLFAELVSSGVINSKQGLSLLGNVLRNVISQDKEDHSNFPIILSFCRHCGEEYAGLIPKRILDLAEKYNFTIPKSDFLSPEKQQNLRALLKDYFRTLCTHLLSEHSELQSMTRNIRHIMESKGEVSNEKKEKCELKQANFDKLLASAQTLSDLLSEALPEFPKDQEKGSSGNVLDNLIDENSAIELDPWGDEETKSFYTDLPDLRLFLPNFSAPKQQEPSPTEEEPAMTEETLDMDIEPDQLEVDDPPSNSSDPPVTSSTPEPEAQPPPLPGPTLGTGVPKGNVNTKQQFERFLQNLTNCVNKEFIDSAAIEFLLNFNTKNNRKKVTKSIFGVQRTRLDLLPFLARFVAIVNLVSRDVANELCQMLKLEFKWHIKKKNQMNIESKIKIVRFIGELVKFGLYPKIEALFCLKILLHDFQHHQIEMACSLFEVAGQYLYNCRDTRLRTNVYLEQMIRLKTATALDTRHSNQIESVYYLVKPPENLSKTKKVRPPMHDFIRHLIFEELDKNTVEKCIKLMRRLDWEDPEINAYACKCLSKAYLLRFPVIRWLADLVSGLSFYQEQAIIKVVDTVFEDIRAGLEIHSPKLAQRRVAMTKYLGELYNYKLVDSSSILNTLYSIISLGVSMEEGVQSPLDPPDSLFRLKLACVLLETCGQYFTSSFSRKRLDYFLIFFQHYYWFKKSNPAFNRENTSDLFPILADHMYKDCLATVRPKLKLYKSLEEAKEAIEQLQQELYPELFGAAGNDEKSDAGETGDNLKPIHEDTESDVASRDSSTVESDYDENAVYDDEEQDQDQDQDHDDKEYQEQGQEGIDYDNDNDDDDNNYDEEDYDDDDYEDDDGEYDDEEDEDGDDEDDGDDGDEEDEYDDQDQEDIEDENLDDQDDDDEENDDEENEDLVESLTDPLDEIEVELPKKLEKTQEDIEFEQMFEKVATDSYQERLRESIKPSTKDIPVPMMSKSHKKTYDQLQGSEVTPSENEVSFVLMLRSSKSGKQQFKTFKAPTDSQLAINLKLQEQKIKEENERVKRLTLNITERLEEEDYQESLLQSQKNLTQNRSSKQSRQPKFKHQKGVPDADLIFN